MSLKLDDVTLAQRIAAGAGAILKGIRSGGLLRGHDLGAAGDELAQRWIASVLANHRPDDGMLSEEAPDEVEERLSKDRVWIIDPLDGTREFSTGRLDWAVHISLVENGLPVVAAVAMPDLNRVWHTANVQAVTGPYSNKIVISPHPSAGLRRVRGRSCWPRTAPNGFGRCQRHVRAPWRRRCLHSLRRTVRMGFLRSGGRGTCCWPALLPSRWLSAGLQPGRYLPSGSLDLP